MGRGERIAQTAVLLKRFDVLERLCDGPAQVRDLVEETEHSRRTINRTVTELEDEGFLTRGSNGIEITTSGRLAQARLGTFLDDLGDITAADPVLEPLSSTTDIDPDLVVGAEVISASKPTAFRALEEASDELQTADRYWALVPTIADARYVRLLYEHVVTRGKPAQLVVSEAVFETLRSAFPRRMEAMATEGECSIFVGDVPPYRLEHFERETVDGRTALVTMTVYTDAGSIHGLFRNDTDAAIRCARERYDSCRERATDRTEAVIPGTDGGVTAADTPPTVPAGQILPLSLERQGFVTVDVSYFGDTPVADPPTAWRAGFSLAEVHTGYAIDRLPAASDDADGPTLTETIIDTLESGTHSILIGPPGAGKSTLCKRVACAWYEADHGPVFYRQSDRGRPFDAVDDLVSTIEQLSGHTLVVVEDVLRPDANEIFEALEQLAEHGDVSFLFDAREHEWHEGGSDVIRQIDAAVDVLPLPPVREAECAALIAHAERTLGRSLGLSTDELRSATRDGEDCHELLRLTHQLATHADPLIDEPTALEESVRRVRHELSADLELDVCILANTLVAAGIDFEPGLLYAVGDPAAFDDVDEVIRRLEGDVLFSLPAGGYRTVHEEWARLFLSHAVEADTDGASARFRRVVTAVLALAADPARCRQIGAHLDEPTALEDAIASPGRWGSAVLEAVFDLCKRQVTLTPLLGDGGHAPFDLPALDAARDMDALRSAVKGQKWLGDRFLEAGHLEQSKRAYERLDPEEPTERRQQLFGLGWIAYKRGEYDDAIRSHEEGLSLAEAQDHTESQCHHHNHLGLSFWRLGEYEAGREHFEASIDLARDLESPTLEGKAQIGLGGISWAQGEYDQARASNEFQAARSREIGNPFGEAQAINNLGVIARAQGAYDRAVTHHEEALAIARERGFRSIEANCLNNLGHVAAARESFDEARDFHEAALEVGTEIEGWTYCGESHWRLGAAAIGAGAYERAKTHLDEATDRFEDLGNRTYLARVALSRARLAFEEGDLETAKRLARDAHGQAVDLGAMNERARCRQLLGRLALAEDDVDGARDHWEAALETFAEREMYDAALETLEQLFELWCDLGDEPRMESVAGHAIELWTAAPPATAALHHEWVSTAQS